MAIPVQLKRSATPGSEPGALLEGEVALNETDRKLFTRNGAGSSIPTDLDHDKRTNNPHGVTANQVGAMTTAQTNQAIASALEALEAEDVGAMTTAQTNQAIHAAVISKSTDQSVPEAEQSQFRRNAHSAPIDAIGYHGVQVNGSLLVSQEHGYDIDVSTTDRYICDQMRGGNSFTVGGIFSEANNPLPSFASARLRAATARSSYSSSEFDFLYSLIEGTRLRNRLFWGTPAAKPLFVSFMVAAETSGRFYLSIRNFDATTPTRSYLVPFDLVANEPTVCWAVIPGDTSGTWKTDHSIGLQIAWCFGSGTLYGAGIGNTWQSGNHIAASDVSNFFSAVNKHVWLGPWVAIPGSEGPKTFDELVRCQRPYEEELRLCRRYWFLRGVYPVFTRATTSFNSYFKNFYYDEMRVSPVVTHDRSDAFIHKPFIRWDTQADFIYSASKTGVFCKIAPTTDDPAVSTFEAWTTFQFDARM